MVSIHDTQLVHAQQQFTQKVKEQGFYCSASFSICFPFISVFLSTRERKGVSA